ncbi:hypothetical protein [Micromonospora sp. WMMD737]|uniref:hypothetical protein n=1 Tax=Micromonospora sp. WMMD737 TaxID=3404113 RepID=UPI003B9590E6
MFLSCSPVRKAPKDTGSKRRLSPQRLEEHASLLVVQALSARKAYRPIGWLALVLYDLDTHRPPGASRADARSNIAAIAAILASSADWGSGRRSRPGRQVTAGLTGRCEKTVTRHLALLEARGLTEGNAAGQLLTKQQRVDVQADPDATADQRARWTNRAEWRLLIPDWTREITDEEIWPYIEQAAALLDDLAAPARAGRAVDNPADPVVDNRPGQPAPSLNVPPSITPQVLTCVPVRRSSFSLPPTVDNVPDGASPVAVETEQKGGALRLSPTRRGSRGSRGRLAPGVVRLAREMVTDDRFPYTRGPNDILPIAGVLHARKLGRWTIEDLVAEAELRLAECHKSMVTVAKAPASYTAWLLAKAVPDEPPAQIAAALAESARADLIARVHRQSSQWHQREQHRVDATASEGGRAARALVDELAARRHHRKLAGARRYDEISRDLDTPADGTVTS